MPWVKWHSASLDDYDFGKLPDHVKWQAVGLATLAALNGNELPSDVTWLKSRLQSTTKIDLQLLESSGFIEACQNGDNLTPDRQPNEEKRKRREEKRKNRDAWAKRFDSFWVKYPKKKAKPKARESWLKHEGEDFDKIIAGLEKQVKSDQWTRNNGQYIPYPATWLNQRRWEDEPDSRQPGGQTYPTREEAMKKHGYM
jgi:hypothetical protein